MSVRGRGNLWPCLGNCPHYFGIAFTIPKSGPDVAIMRIIAASKSADYSGPVPILRPNNADIIRIIDFVKGVSVSPYESDSMYICRPIYIYYVDKKNLQFLSNNSEKLVQILLEFSQQIVEGYEFVLVKFCWKRPIHTGHSHMFYHWG